MIKWPKIISVRPPECIIPQSLPSTYLKPAGATHAAFLALHTILGIRAGAPSRSFSRKYCKPQRVHSMFRKKGREQSKRKDRNTGRNRAGERKLQERVWQREWKSMKIREKKTKRTRARTRAPHTEGGGGRKWEERERERKRGIRSGRDRELR